MPYILLKCTSVHHNRNQNSLKTSPVWQTGTQLSVHNFTCKSTLLVSGRSYFSAGMTGNPSACSFWNRKPSNDSNEDMRHDTFPGVAGGLSLSICRRAHII